jgi:twitching motility protein PilI
MAAVISEGPYEHLRRLHERGHAAQRDLPAQAETREEWSGVGFRIGGSHYLAAMGEVTEILSVPELARIPHTRGWVRGMANVRGNLLPVMDLAGYLGKGEIAINSQARVLVIDQEGLVAGLLVEEVLGMRRFYQDDWRRAERGGDEAAYPYVAGVFRHDSGLWPVFSMVALARDPAFFKVSE